MKSIVMIGIGFVIALLIAILLLPTLGSRGSQVQAQSGSGCVDFRALWQAALPTPKAISPATDVWGGPVYGMLGQDVFLADVLTGNDGQDYWHKVNGIGKGGLFVMCLQYPTCTDTFTYEVSNAAFALPPGKLGTGQYIGNSAKIIGGTGRFASASGNLNVSGPWLTWPDENSPFGASGRFNATISGRVCGIQ
jgi:hypothetical protein